MADHDEIGVVLRGSPHDLVRGMSRPSPRFGHFFPFTELTEAHALAPCL
jgi:hypothetical protein